MKIIKVLTAVLFSLLILVPLAMFNLEEESVSEIDNRMLAYNPFSEKATGDFTTRIENYVNDRIGLRDEMILGYTVLNDWLFGKMVHPTYSYGKDGYVFGAGITVNTKYGEFHEAFADMVKELQDYCQDRGIPFLFVFNPAKPAVLQEYLADGINYDRSWVEQFLQALDERGVRYVDNTEVLSEAWEQGVMVFNQKYDANHWNAVGALYGCNAMLEELQKDFPAIHLTTQDDVVYSTTVQTTLQVSQFPIYEEVPKISLRMKYESLTSLYTDEVERHNSYRGFGYYVNQERLEAGAPRALVFQGSYMNTKGYAYCINGFGEYIHVHDYQNVLEMPYYLNIFQPDCVIFEVAEYTFKDSYFSLSKMLNLDLNPVLDPETAKLIEPEKTQITVETGTVLTKIIWNTADQYEYVWLAGETVYDMRACTSGYEVTVTNEAYEALEGALSIYVAES